MKGTKKKLVPFRLWEDTIEKVKAKNVIDRTNFQRCLEALVYLYLEDQPDVMKKIKSSCKDKHARKRRYNSFDEMETQALFHKIEQMSELNETQQILEELDKEEKK